MGEAAHSVLGTKLNVHPKYEENVKTARSGDPALAAVTRGKALLS